jgi:hypothetical protein
MLTTVNFMQQQNVENSCIVDLIVNLKENGMKKSYPNLKKISRKFPGDSEGN